MSKARSTLFPNGVSNAAPNSFSGLANLRSPDPTIAHIFFDDFDTFITPAVWFVDGAGSAQVILDNDDGVLQTTNGVNAGDHSNIHLPSRTYFMIRDKEFWYKILVGFSSRIVASIFLGLWDTAVDPASTPPVDGLYFRSIAADGRIEFVMRKDDVETVLDLGNIPTGAIQLDFHYDGAGTLTAYVNGTALGETSDLTNFPDDEVLRLAMYMDNGTGNSLSMDVDYVYVSKER